MGVLLLLRYVLSGWLLNKETQLFNNVILSEISGQKGTLMYDGWNNKKLNHLVAIVILINGKPYSTQTFDNSVECQNAALAFTPIKAKINRVQTEFHLKVIAVYTNSGFDQIILYFKMFFYLNINKFFRCLLKDNFKKNFISYYITILRISDQSGYMEFIWRVFFYSLVKSPNIRCYLMVEFLSSSAVFTG